MIKGKKIIVVFPAYNAENTLKKTFNKIPFDIVGKVILTDDFSSDQKVRVTKKLGIEHNIQQKKNKGYGANQKSCYNKAIALNADIIVMLHPDYQYNPKLIPAMCSLIANGVFKVILGSRILGKITLKDGMPFYNYISNRVLTLFQNFLMDQKISEYHTGYRSFNAEILKEILFNNNSDDFIFDNQLLAQFCYKRIEIGEISCPAKYEKGSSSINFMRNVTYGIEALGVSIRYFLQKKRFLFKLFNPIS